jgi:hypothetical protein
MHLKNIKNDKTAKNHNSPIRISSILATPEYRAYQQTLSSPTSNQHSIPLPLKPRLLRFSRYPLVFCLLFLFPSFVWRVTVDYLWDVVGISDGLFGGLGLGGGFGVLNDRGLGFMERCF